MDWHIDKDFKIEYDPQVSNETFFVNSVGSQSWNNIEEITDNVDTDKSIYISKTDGNDTTGDGTIDLPYATIAKALSMLNAEFTYIIVLDSEQYSEDLSASDFTYFLGIFSAVGEAPQYTTRTLSFTPANSNSIFVSKEGDDDTGDGTIENPYLTITKAITETDATHTAIVILDSGAYEEEGFTMSDNFKGLYSAIGQSPVVSLTNPDIYIDTFEAVQVDGVQNFLEYDWNYNGPYSKAIVLKNGNVVMLYIEGTAIKFKIVSKAGAEVLAPVTIKSGESSYYMNFVLLDNGYLAFVIKYSTAAYCYYCVYNQAGTAIKTLTQIPGFGGTGLFDICALHPSGFVILSAYVSGSNYTRRAVYNNDGVLLNEVTNWTYQPYMKAVAFKSTNKFAVILGPSGYTSGSIYYYVYNNDNTQVVGATAIPTAYRGSSHFCGASLNNSDKMVLLFKHNIGAYDTHASCFFINSAGEILKSSDVVYGFGELEASHISAMVTDGDEFVISMVTADDPDKLSFVFYDEDCEWTKTSVAMASSPNEDAIMTVPMQNNAIMVWQTKLGGALGQFRIFSEVLWNAITNSVAADAEINGIIFDQDGIPGSYTVINSSTPLTIKYCEFKNVNIESAISAGYVITGTISVFTNNKIHDTDRGIYITSYDLDIQQNQFYNITLDYAISIDVDDEDSDITIDHCDFFNCYGGIQLLNNVGDEIIKNSIFYKNGLYNIYADEEVTLINSVYTGSFYQAVAGASTVKANPLYVNEGFVSSIDLDLNIKTVIGGYKFNSPAYLLADDDFNSGAIKIQYFAFDTTWSSAVIEKDIEGINFSYNPVKATSNITMDGTNHSSVVAWNEVIEITFRGLQNQYSSAILDMLYTKNPLVRVYANNSTYPNEYELYNIIYSPVARNNKHYKLFRSGSSGMKIVLSKAGE